MYLYVNRLPSGQEQTVVSVPKVGASHPLHHEHQLQAIPDCVVHSCGVLACLQETTGSTVLPFAATKVQNWLRLRESLLSAWSCANDPFLHSRSALEASQVADFLQDEHLDLFTEASAKHLIISRRSGFRAGPQVDLSHDLPVALLCDILWQLTRKTCIRDVLQQTHTAVRPHAASTCVERGCLRLCDAFSASSELLLFLEHLPHHPNLLYELHLTKSSRCTLKLPNAHRSIDLLSNLLSSQSNLHTLDLSGIVVPRAFGPASPPDSATLRLGHIHLPRSIRHLALSRCELSHHPTATLQRIITSLNHLSYLDISHNNLGVLGISALAPSLRSLASLATLDISSNSIRREGATALAPHLSTLTALTALLLASNVLQAQGVAALTEAFPSLPLLATLDISGSVFSEAGALTIAGALPRMTALKSLNLAWSALCDTGVSNLRLGFIAPRNPPSAAGVTSLSLRNNNVTSAATGSLCVICMQLSRTLQHLDLSCNRLRWGVGVLAGSVTTLVELRTLLLRDTCMRASDFALLAPALADLKHLSHVDVSSNQLSSPLGVLLESVHRKALETFRPPPSPCSTLHAPHTGAERGSGELPQILPHRQCMQCGYMHVADACAAGCRTMAVPQNTSITHLMMSSGFDAEGGLMGGVGAWGVPAVVHDLVREIVDRAVEDVAFGVAYGHNVHRAWRPPAVSFPNLQVLDLSGTSDAFPGVSGLVSHCGGALESLNLSRTGMTACMARMLSTPLSQCSRLTSLDISNNACMGTAGGLELAAAVSACMPRLHMLSLAMCDAGGAAIAEACITGSLDTATQRMWAATSRSVSDPGVQQAAVHSGNSRSAASPPVPPVHEAVARSAPATFAPPFHAVEADLASEDTGSHACMDTPVATGVTTTKNTTSGDAPATSLASCEAAQGTSEGAVPVRVATDTHAQHACTKVMGGLHQPASDPQLEESRGGCRRASAPVISDQSAACCVAHSAAGTALAPEAAAAAAAAAPGLGGAARGGTQPPLTAGVSGAQGSKHGSGGGAPRAARTARARRVLPLHTLNLKGVALGQDAGIEVLRELAVCAPRLRKLDIGHSQISEGAHQSQVRQALHSLTQVKVLGLSGLDL